MARTARVVAVSNRATDGGHEDRTGPVIAAWPHSCSYAATGPALPTDADPAASEPPDTLDAVFTGQQQHPTREPGAVFRADVVDTPLSVEELAKLVERDAAGAIVTFGGVVRDHDDQRSVQELEYIGHPTATTVIAEVADEIAARFDGVHALAVSHRIGLLSIGDVALACAVAAEHREQAFTACSELVDEVKRRLPIWKRQVFADKTEEWVNCP
ncbi:molybdenum cofactor biosynthesis protein MoaE [Saccharopolyspora mangrovi]|uniref:Molybdenum cofactor biosynthesis protein MoaE n=1 Tax=Saccharopolyspora mangrovi TaxID=3082379 RepID=A0ABU6A5D7_9PSEU|nr:molybdenum cofactor biosynthesis protein MoaE [Saccharopolyspora sp. S2-29]MEB3366680.1 molybdenum cofactor biosynthesis protein MoaE [Saccharopolyspora sp. S2-29]